MMRRLGGGLAAGLFAGSLALATLSSAAEFSEPQKGEIEAIIKDYLMKHPEVIREAIQELERRDDARQAELQRQAIKENAAAIFHSADDLVGGNKEGKIAVVEFFDYNCGYCKHAFKDVMQIIETDKDVRLVLKEFPILGPGSVYAARAALASREQGKYWDFHLALIGHDGKVDEKVVDEIAVAIGLDLEKLKKDMDSSATSNVLEGNLKLAEALQISGTPAFIIDQTLIPGAMGYAALTQAVNQVRENGCQVC